jgi:hypothetical protein
MKRGPKEKSRTGIRVKLSEHESGCNKTYFSSFECLPVSKDNFAQIFESTRAEIGATPITQVYLKGTQSHERQILEEMGFILDGIAYSVDVNWLAAISRKKQPPLNANYQIRALKFEQDIDEVVKVEKSIHAADNTSRVNFETQASINSMKDYYRRIAAADGAFVLSSKERIIGIVGFMKGSKDKLAAQISSIGIDLPFQGQGLFFPFIHEAFLMSPFKGLRTLTGVTTTHRLISASEKYGAKIIGHLLSKHS